MAVKEEDVRTWLQSVADPEIPVLTIEDLGILRDVRVENEDEVTVTITPTYTGCPAMDVIGMNIRMVLLGRGFKKVNIEQQLSPAWTTDWITEAGKKKMLESGIAPPKRRSSDALGLFEDDEIPCPKCQSAHTELISKFGATSCKAMYRCLHCKEPFEHFKCH